MNELLLTGLYDKGYKHPSPIQAACIPLLLLGGEGNVVAQAPAGSGKTAAIAVGLLNNVTDINGGLQGVCICHTRELAIQNFRYIKKIAELTEIKVAIAIPEYNEKGTREKSEEDLIPFLAANL